MKTLFRSLFVLALISLLQPISTYAVDDTGITYQTLAPIGNFIPPSIPINSSGLSDYLNKLFQLGIAIAGLLAVVMIVWGGFQYLSTDAIKGVSEGKKKIQDALWGLVMALLSYLILNTINPQILSTELSVTKLEIKEVQGGEGNQFLTLEEEKREAAAENGYDASTYDGPSLTYNPDEEAFPGYEDYDGNTYAAKDNSGRAGQVIAGVQYLKDFIPGQFTALYPSSTYRSHEHNDAVGGSKTSDHLSGKAIDFHQNSKSSKEQFNSDGNALVQYMLNNGRSLGVDQIIFQDKNYIASGNGWKKGSAVHGHYDHVHIGFQ